MTLIRQNVFGAVLASSGAGCRNLILIPPLKGLEHSENTYIQLTASGRGGGFVKLQQPASWPAGLQPPVVVPIGSIRELCT